MLGKAVWQRACGHSSLDVVHEPRVHPDVLLALLQHLGLPRRKDAGDVLERRVALDGELARDALFRDVSIDLAQGGLGTYLTDVSRSMDSAFSRTTTSIRTSSTRRPYVTVTMTDAA